MKIAIDMDNTISDEFGSSLRPGIIEFVTYLKKKHEIYLWTNSKKERAFEILNHFELRKMFSGIITREDYDPEDVGKRKDIREKGFDILIDDDPEEINYTLKNHRIGILVKSYRKNTNVDPNEFRVIIEKYKI
jgi:FMN phosphatase YigB (HAD superfamily)